MYFLLFSFTGLSQTAGFTTFSYCVSDSWNVAIWKTDASLAFPFDVTPTIGLAVGAAAAGSSSSSISKGMDDFPFVAAGAFLPTIVSSSGFNGLWLDDIYKSVTFIL
jgi:hypothetical protein